MSKASCAKKTIWIMRSENALSITFLMLHMHLKVEYHHAYKEVGMYNYLSDNHIFPPSEGDLSVQSI